MKKIFIIILITSSLFAIDENHTREIPMYIVDTQSFNLINSKDAFFILGSQKTVSMKNNFGFANKNDADEYVKINGGCVVDYETYSKMDDNEVIEYVKKHGITIVVDKNSTSKETNSSISDVYSKENMNKYKF